MADLVSLQEARDHIRSTTTADDSWFAVWIPAISDAVFGWLKDEWRAYELQLDSDGGVIEDSEGEPFIVEDSNGPVVRPRVKAAVLVELAMQYRFREGDGTMVPSHHGHGYVLGQGATNLLASLRKTTVA